MRYVYSFGAGKVEAKGKALTRNVLGAEGMKLMELTRTGFPVPAGFTITVPACEEYYKLGRKLPSALWREVKQALAKLERTTGKRLGDANEPLLVSVRSSVPRSMPGMMGTILNLGLNNASVGALTGTSSYGRFVCDAYRRLIMMYGSTVKGIDCELFEDALDRIKDTKTRFRLGEAPGAMAVDTKLDSEELQELSTEFQRIYEEQCGEAFPQDPWEQLKGAIHSIFNGWTSEMAVTYRRIENITDLRGTAVNVLQMVFGNKGENSGTGVCFTRDPSSGENSLYGDYLTNAQGEDVVAGIRTPVRVETLAQSDRKAHRQLLALRKKLESKFRDMEDLEFTIEEGQLYLIQCRTGKRAPQATFRIAVEMVEQGLITKEQAIDRITPEDAERLFYAVLDTKGMTPQQLDAARIASGINAVPGAAVGQVVFTAIDAIKKEESEGVQVILVRQEVSPEDVGGMHAAHGILTATGSKTSHAAVVARGWGKCCVVGCEALDIDYHAKQMTVGGRTIKHGDIITLDGSTGAVYGGSLPLTTDIPEAFHTLMKWCDEFRRLRIRANADTATDAAKAVEMGAEGIGLCRTEHMFFETRERRLAMQEMIVAESEQARRAALDKLLPSLRKDFLGIFEAVEGRPVTIRLLDPPLHEFLPYSEDDMQRLAEHAHIDVQAIRKRAEYLQESNPMLGHRGCRLCITYPEILEMQVRAIIEAAVDLKKRSLAVSPEIMIPSVIAEKELRIVTDRVHAVADPIIEDAGVHLKYLVGPMVETPRAALTADKLANVADFFSFGTNDLTQLTMGLSRDDAGKFLPDYIDLNKAGVFSDDPFQSLDQKGVGLLIKWGIERGRGTKSRLKIGICGEHGGEAKSVRFCHSLNMDYVSCSPYRVPIARLAAAQAAISDSTLRLPSPPIRTRQRKDRRKTARVGLVLEKHIRHGSGIVWDLAIVNRTVLCASSESEVTQVTMGSATRRSTLRAPDGVNAISISPSSACGAVGCNNGSIFIWNLATNRRIARFKHGTYVEQVSWTPDSRFVASCANDAELRLHSVRAEEHAPSLTGEESAIACLTFPDSGHAVIGCRDGSLRLLHLRTGECRAAMLGHANAVNSVVIRPGQRQVISGSDDYTVKLWDLDLARCLGTLEGHEKRIWRLAVSPDGKLLASVSQDGTVRLWDLDTADCIEVLQFTSAVYAAAFTGDGTRLVLGGESDDLRIFGVNVHRSLTAKGRKRQTTQYSNAKVVLLGESGIGKSTLANRLTKNRWIPAKPTHGMQVWPLALKGLSTSNVEKEVWLWDLAGQPTYRLVHQLFLDATALALVLYDPREPDPFKHVEAWEHALRLAVRRDSEKLLVASKVDQPGTRISLKKVSQYQHTHGYLAHVATSARTGQGRDELLQGITTSIPWNRIPWLSTPTSRKLLKDAVLALRNSAATVLAYSALADQLRRNIPHTPFADSDLKTVIHLLGQQNVVRALEYGNIVLLRPEIINDYASAMVMAARATSDGIGSLSLQDALEGNFDLSRVQRLSIKEERMFLPAVVQLLCNTSRCIRMTGEASLSERLLFPSEYDRALPPQDHLSNITTHTFAGPVSTIYTIVVVRLASSRRFGEPSLWKDSAIFGSEASKQVALFMSRLTEGKASLTIGAGDQVSPDALLTFITYVQTYLERNAVDCKRHRHYRCSTAGCGAYLNQTDIESRMRRGLGTAQCPGCKAQVVLLDDIERECNATFYQASAQAVEDRATVTITNDNKAAILEGEILALAAHAGQICRLKYQADKGIDAEIEFTNRHGRAAGRMIMLQLKHGDSYLTRRQGDGAEVFTAKREHLAYWTGPLEPVYLVVRSGAGELQWMNVTEYLLNRPDKDSRQIVFSGESLDELAVIRLRNRTLAI